MLCIIQFPPTSQSFPSEVVRITWADLHESLTLLFKCLFCFRNVCIFLLAFLEAILVPLPAFWALLQRSLHRETETCWKIFRQSSLGHLPFWRLDWNQALSRIVLSLGMPFPHFWTLFWDLRTLFWADCFLVSMK